MKLQVNGVDKSFGKNIAVQQIDLSITEGTIHGLLGSNGAGKTTLMKVLSAIYKADSGTADYFSFTEILDITETSEMYTVELSDEEMDTFFDDFKTMPIYDLTDEYELEEVYESNDGRKDMINHINKEGLAPEGNKLLIYSYPDFGGPMNGSSAEIDFSILAIH